jgi:hypothetical protein
MEQHKCPECGGALEETSEFSDLLFKRRETWTCPYCGTEMSADVTLLPADSSITLTNSRVGVVGHGATIHGGITFG